MWLGGRTGRTEDRFQGAEWNWVDGSPSSYSNFPQSGSVLTFVNSIDSCPAQGCWKMQDKSQSSSLKAVCQGISNNMLVSHSFTIFFPYGIHKVHYKPKLM